MMTDLPRVLDVVTARRLGVTRSQVRTEVGRGHWRLLARGVVLTRPDPPARTDWAAVGLGVAGSNAVLSGWDAVRYYGLGALSPPSVPVLVLSDRSGCRDLGGVHIRRTAGPLDARSVSVRDDALPLARLAAPARAVVDTAMQIPTFAGIRALVTASVQKGACTPGELIDQLPKIARRDSGRLRKALEDVVDGAHSEAEAKALTSLRLADVPAFELNVALIDVHGRVIAVADVLWRELRAILEVDSRQFHFSEVDWHQTSDRHNRLTSHGFALVHYPPARFDGESWLVEVVAWLKARARELSVHYVADPHAIRDGEPFVLT